MAMKGLVTTICNGERTSRDVIVPEANTIAAFCEAVRATVPPFAGEFRVEFGAIEPIPEAEAVRCRG